MTPEEKQLEYKEILSAFRNGDEVRCPDAFEEALTALESDPELARWFEEDQVFDADFRSALAEFEAPELKPMSDAESAPSRVIRFPLLKLAVAAGLALVAGGLIFSTHNRQQNERASALVAEWRTDMAAFAASQFELDAMNNDLSVLQDLIQSKGGSEGAHLKDVFATGLPMGCKIIDWDGRTVSLYCFGNGQEQVVHAFLVPLDELNGKYAANHLRGIERHSERDTGGFVVGDTAYMLVSSMPGVDIKPFLLPAQQIYLASLLKALGCQPALAQTAVYGVPSEQNTQR